MKKAVFAFILAFGCLQVSQAQSDLNAYKYIIVPNQYDFFKKPDMYQLNSLTKFLFNKYGFNAIMEDEGKTDELRDKPCLALRTNVINNSGIFKTKLVVELRNCMDEVIFTSREGETREKLYSRAFNFALRDAFVSFEGMNYEYQPSEEEVAAETEPAQEEEDAAEAAAAAAQEKVARLEQEIEDLKKAKAEQEQQEAAKVIEEAPVEVAPVEKVVEKPAEVLPVEEAKPEEQPKKVEVKAPEMKAADSDLLYAQPTANGYQLVDSTPKVVYRIRSSGQDHMYFVEGRQAIIYKSDTDWILEYYENDTLKKEVLKIKF